MEDLREDGLEQAEALVKINLGLSQKQLDSLNDIQFIEKASLAYFIEDRKALAVKHGIVLALNEMFEN